jgi:hypothetical protein
LEQRLLRLENSNGQQRGMFGLGPSEVLSLAADEKTATMGVRVAFVEAEVKNLRYEMRAEAINMGRFTFVSLVGAKDWVARNQVSSIPTLFLDIVSVLQVA